MNNNKLDLDQRDPSHISHIRVAVPEICYLGGRGWHWAPQLSAP